MWSEAVVLMTNPGVCQPLEWLLAVVHSQLLYGSQFCVTHPWMYSLPSYESC